MNQAPHPLSPLGSAVSTPTPTHNNRDKNNQEHIQHPNPQPQQLQSQVSIADSSDLESLSNSEPPPEDVVRSVPKPQPQNLSTATFKHIPEDVAQDSPEIQDVSGHESTYQINGENETSPKSIPGEPEPPVSEEDAVQVPESSTQIASGPGKSTSLRTISPKASSSGSSSSSLAELSSSTEGRRSERGREKYSAIATAASAIGDGGTVPDTALSTYPPNLTRLQGALRAKLGADSGSSSDSSSSSSEEEEQGGKNLIRRYIEVTLDSGRKRPAWIVDYIAKHNSHYVRYVDDDGGNERVYLKRGNYRFLNPVEEHKYSSKDSETRSTRAQPEARATRVQPKRARPQPPPKPKDIAIRMKRQKLYDQDSPPPLTPDAELTPGHELVGEVITVRWPSNGRHYAALVVGCQDRVEPRDLQPERRFRVHKIFYVVDESTEEIELIRREWKRGLGDTKWDNSGLVGRRIIVMWDVEVDDDEFGNCDQLPYEAFVVKYLGNTKYRLLYTQHDQLEDRDLNINHDSWDLSEPGCWNFNNLPIQTWSTVFQLHPVNQVA